MFADFVLDLDIGPLGFGFAFQFAGISVSVLSRAKLFWINTALIGHLNGKDLCFGRVR